MSTGIHHTAAFPPRTIMLLRTLSVCALAAAMLPSLAVQAQEVILVDFSQGLDASHMILQDARPSLNDGVLRLDLGRQDSAPGIVLTPPGGRWDLSAYHEIAVDVKNCGTNPVTVQCRAENPDFDGSKHGSSTHLDLAPGERSVLRVTLTQAVPPELRVRKLTHMRGIPLGLAADIDPSNIARLAIFVANPKEDCCLEIESPRIWILCEPTQAVDPDELFPMIDRFGQYLHKEWPGKTHSEEDLAAQRKQEAVELAAHPSPADRDQYGGWKSGPQLKATGFFRAEKYQGKWWLVDPEGRLFWSYGTSDIGVAAATAGITERAHWFAGLPPKSDSPLSQFYSQNGPGADNPSYEKFNFTGANLFRKFGENWRDENLRVTFERFHSWSFNTLDDNPTRDEERLGIAKKIPYFVGVWIGGVKSLAARDGYWGPIYDVFEPEFPAIAERTIAGVAGGIANDPWCIGAFIDNELSWGNESAIGIAALRSPPEQPAKQVMLEDLQKKYETIERLNAAWDASYPSWEALAQSTSGPDRKKANADLVAFTARFCDRYFSVHRDLFKKAAPNHMYLGCRFSRSNEPAVRAAAKYCDVISFNRYQYTVADLRLPKGEDKPVLISEFHFGALDRGLFHPTLGPTIDQNDRARKIKNFVHSAIDNPLIVGVNWYMYRELSSTGLPDDEIYQLGLVDVCDRPYPETIQAFRELGGELYQRRTAP
jgi:hypothetical protein